MLSKISGMLNLPVSEIKVIVFILSLFAAGFILKSVIRQAGGYEIRKYDYSYQDSLFESIRIAGDSVHLLSENGAKKVDYKQEVLDFNGRDFKKSKKDSLPAEKSIELNSASVQSLMRLPGIGPKTAERIIEYRNSKGGFSSLDELMNVKGIGEIKLGKIIKYIFIANKEIKFKVPEEK